MVNWNDEDRYDLLPVVGGPHHGVAWPVPRDCGPVFKILDPIEFHVSLGALVPYRILDSDVSYDVRRVIGIMPGRIDRQIFSVLVRADCSAMPSGLFGLQDAVRLAWSNGWSPPDDASEYAREPYLALWLKGWRP